MCKQLATLCPYLTLQVTDIKLRSQVSKKKVDKTKFKSDSKPYIFYTVLIVLSKNLFFVQSSTAQLESLSSDQVL